MALCDIIFILSQFCYIGAAMATPVCRAAAIATIAADDDKFIH